MGIIVIVPHSWNKWKNWGDSPRLITALNSRKLQSLYIIQICNLQVNGISTLSMTGAVSTEEMMTDDARHCSCSASHSWEWQSNWRHKPFIRNSSQCKALCGHRTTGSGASLIIQSWYRQLRRPHCGWLGSRPLPGTLSETDEAEFLKG